MICTDLGKWDVNDIDGITSELLPSKPINNSHYTNACVNKPSLSFTYKAPL